MRRRSPIRDRDHARSKVRRVNNDRGVAVFLHPLHLQLCRRRAREHIMVFDQVRLGERCPGKASERIEEGKEAGFYG